MTEETFVRELERRAELVHGAPLSLDDVRGRATAIRRRRRAAASAAVAAVVAFAIVVPTVLGGGTPKGDAPEPAPSPSPSPSPSGPVVPGASVLHDGVVTLPDGGTVPIGVDNNDVSQFGVLTDGRVVVASSKPHGVQVYSLDGELEDEYAVALNAITMSADDDLVAWIDETFRIQVLESGVAEPTTLRGIPMPGESPGSIDAVLGSDCANGGCTVLGGDFTTTTTESTATTQKDLRTAEPLRVTDVSPDGDLWAVRYPDDSDPQYGCSGIYDPDAGQMVARNCDTSNLTFSPDGEHLLGGLFENNMASEITVLDRDLQVVSTYDPSPRVVSRAGWADATQVLVSVAGLEDSQWSLVRVGLDGHNEVVDGPVGGGNPEGTAEFLFSE